MAVISISNLFSEVSGKITSAHHDNQTTDIRNLFNTTISGQGLATFGGTFGNTLTVTVTAATTAQAQAATAQNVVMTPATTLAAFTYFLQNLPTVKPTVVGTIWSNGGVIMIYNGSN